MGYFKNLEELLSEHYPEENYIVNKLIPSNSVNIVSGEPRAFKTYFLLHLALCTASGEPLFGNSDFSTQQAAVGYVDLENGDRLLQRRLLQLGATANLPIYFTSDRGFKLTKGNVESMVYACANDGIRLLIIDGLRAAHDMDENSAQDMNRVMNFLRIIADSGVAVIAIQHNRKPGANSFANASHQVRGSTALIAATDTALSISRRNLTLTLEQTKQRYDLELKPFKVAINIEEGTDSFKFDYIGSEKPAVNNNQRLRVGTIALLKQYEQLSQTELLGCLRNERKLDTNEHKLREAIREWLSEGWLVKSPGRGKTKLYSLNAEASDELKDE